MKFLVRILPVFSAAVLVTWVCFSPLASAMPPRSPGDSAGGAPAADRPMATMLIPGPLRSFLRMAGISQEAAPDEVLPLLARNAFLYGHQLGRKTEYLVLADRYVQLARELQPLAGPDGNIHVKGCDDAGQLIHVLGYQFENGCSHDGASLITADAERAFLTVDSGFPLTKLEESLEKGTPFSYQFPATRIPMLYTENDWTDLVPEKQRGGETLLDLLMNDQSVDRLYSALSKLDPQTRLSLYHAPGLRRLLYYAPVFDFYGSRICIRSGVVAVPGGATSEQAWQDLVGASPHSPGDFVTRLLAKDQGWLAAYFDAVSRVSPEQQAHLAEGDRLRRLYDAYKYAIPGVPAASSVFPRNANLLLLFTRLQWDAQGKPIVPGDLAMWHDVFAREDRAHRTHGLSKRLRAADNPDTFLEALAAYSNLMTNDGPAQVYLSLSSIDSARPAEHRMSRDTAYLLALRYAQLNSWYPIFVEFPMLDDASIHHFVETVDRLNGIQNLALRANVMGAFQAELGIWQILARQQQIESGNLNSSWKDAVQPYAGVGSSIQMFEAARKSLQSIVAAAGGGKGITQDQLVDMLAGPAQNRPEAVRVHQELARRMRSVLDDQRLVSLDALFGLYDGLGEMAHGAKNGDSLLPLAEALREFELPRPIFTSGERVSWSPMVYVSRHAELQVRTDLTKVIKAPGTPGQLETARARLAPFLRDTLVGLNYAYYEPPGAQVLHSNPLFVRSHDFAASSIQGVDEVWGAPALIGIGATAGGGAYLIGSLADLPYVLALTEADFISPEKLQALIWRETVPELLVNAVLPRWWGVSREEMHAVSLYQRAGEEMLAASVTNADLREKIIGIYSERMGVGRVGEIEQALSDKKSAAELSAQMMPTDTFYLAAEFRRRYPEQASEWGPASRELDELAHKNATDTSPQKIAHDFGVPHPTLAETNACALLTSEPFPVSGGIASRLFGESWESGNLYWARLADEMGYPPATLNVLVPELTRQMVANISATSIDDWPALLRAMQQTGEEFRQGRIAVHTAGSIANNNLANGGIHSND